MIPAHFEDVRVAVVLDELELREKSLELFNQPRTILLDVGPFNQFIHV